MSDFFTTPKLIEYITLLTVAVSLIGTIYNTLQAKRQAKEGEQRDRNIQEIHVSLNSELTNLKALIAKSSHAEGKLEGRAEEKANPT